MEPRDPIHRIQDSGYRIQDTGYKIQDKDTGYRLQEQERQPGNGRAENCSV